MRTIVSIWIRSGERLEKPVSVNTFRTPTGLGAMYEDFVSSLNFWLYKMTRLLIESLSFSFKSFCFHTRVLAARVARTFHVSASSPKLNAVLYNSGSRFNRAPAWNCLIRRRTKGPRRESDSTFQRRFFRPCLLLDGGIQLR